jgi:L-aminopeptidase/D-esterase-like protein
MSIFREFGGRASYYTPNELDRLQNPEKYEYTQQGYDAFSASVQKKHDARQAADMASQDAIPYGYVGRGAGDTNPAFSFAGYSGHTSGGTAGNVNLGGRAGIFGSGSTTETTGSGTGTRWWSEVVVLRAVPEAAKRNTERKVE